MRDFLFIAEHPALDFLNTQMAQGGGTVETLTTPSRLADWWAQAGWGTLDADLALLDTARGLREAVRALVVAWTQHAPAPADALATVNTVLATGASYPALAPDLTDAPVATTAPHPFLPLARATLDLVTAHDPALVRPCAGSGCVLWFLDTTKNKRRRWCRMSACGNREKAAAHYRRHHPTPA